MGGGEVTEKQMTSCTAGGNVKWYCRYGKQVRRRLKKLKIELPCDPAIPLLGIYSKEMKSGSRRDICLLQHYSQ